MSFFDALEILNKVELNFPPLFYKHGRIDKNYL